LEDALRAVAGERTVVQRQRRRIRDVELRLGHPARRFAHHRLARVDADRASAERDQIGEHSADSATNVREGGFRLRAQKLVGAGTPSDDVRLRIHPREERDQPLRLLRLVDAIEDVESVEALFTHARHLESRVTCRQAAA